MPDLWESLTTLYEFSKQNLNYSKLCQQNARKLDTLSLYTKIHNALGHLDDLKLFITIDMTEL